MFLYSSVCSGLCFSYSVIYYMHMLTFLVGKVHFLPFCSKVLADFSIISFVLQQKGVQMILKRRKLLRKESRNLNFWILKLLRTFVSISHMNLINISIFCGLFLEIYSFCVLFSVILISLLEY